MSNTVKTDQFFNVDQLARMADASVVVVDEILRPAVDVLFPAMVVLGIKGNPAPKGLLKGRTVYLWVIDPEPKLENIAVDADKVGVVRAARSPAEFLGNPGRVRGFIAENVQRYEPVRKAEPIVEPDRVQAVIKREPVPVTTVDESDIDLATNKEGTPIASLDNCVKVLEHDALFAGKIWYDTFLNRVLHTWGTDVETEWADHNDIALALHFQRVVGIPRVTSRMAGEAVVAYAMREKRNCAYDWLDGLVWDNVPRLRELATLGFGTAPREYETAVCRNLILSMVKRVFEPGCKSDYMPIFEGAQGVGKSRALGILGGAWFAESHESVTSKDFYGVLQGKWLIEISEMHAFKQADVDKIKGIVSCAVDRYRVPYGRHTADHARQCSFAGTTNRDDWNRDDTGARRFWPIKCGVIDHAWLTANRAQLFAEAAHAVRQGESYWEVPWDVAGDEQDQRKAEDTWEIVARHYITHVPSFDDRDRGQATWTRRSDELVDATIFNFLTEALNIPPSRISRADEMRASKALKAIGWQRFQKRVGDRREWTYRPMVGVVGDLLVSRKTQ